MSFWQRTRLNHLRALLLQTGKPMESFDRSANDDASLRFDPGVRFKLAIEFAGHTQT